MPVIEITNIANVDILNFLAIMLFPNDAKDREMHHLINQLNHDLKNLEMQDVLMSRDDLELLLQSPSYESWSKLVADNTKKAIIAGDLCGIVYAMHVFNIPEPSMNKAIFVMREFAKISDVKYGDGERLPISEQTIRNCWSEYRGVAHLWGAFRLNQDYKINDDGLCFTNHGYISFLEVAAGILGFGNGFVPHRAKAQLPLFSGDEMWIFTNAIKPRNLVSDNFPVLMQQMLEKYKAPTNNSFR